MSEGEMDNSSDMNSEDEMGRRDLRRVYLITYSQADEEKFPTRNSFAVAVLAAFSRTNSKVIQWCCSLENHKTSGVHYHMCIKLDKLQRWLAAKNFLAESYGISVHFSDRHANYYTAWSYVTKEDLSAEESEGYPDLKTSKGPTTMNAHVARRRSRKAKVRKSMKECESNDEECIESDETTDECKPQKEKKRKRLSAFEFSQIIVEKGLKNRTDALAFACMQKNEGKTDLAEFIINRGVKTVNEAIATAWEMEGAKPKQLRMAKSRLQILDEAANESCKCQPVLQWNELAVQLLKNNGIAPESFANAMKELLLKGRGKYRNIMLTGPANCGKTFLLNPLNKIYKTFTNPASTSFAWVGAEEAEIVFLNDFRWSQQIIAWHDLLLMLEGQLVHLPAPKSHFAKDTVFDSDTPILATSKHQLVYVKNGAIDERETEMMTVRWKVFNFNRQIPQAEQQEVTACPSCFAKLILDPAASA